MRRAAWLLAAWCWAGLAYGDEYRIQREKSQIRFTVETSVMALGGEVTSFGGTLELPSGTQDLARLSAGKVTAEAKTLTTSSKKANKDMRERVFEVDKYPTILLEVRSLAPTKTPEEYHVSADLTMHGVTKALRFRCKAKTSPGGETLSLEGTTTVKMSDYGMSPPPSIIKVSDEVTLRWSLTASRP